jgi:hypothetical protein
MVGIDISENPATSMFRVDMKMEASYSVEKIVKMQKTTQHHNL